MSNLKLDPLTNDLDISSANFEIVTGDDAILQQLRVRFRFFLGEWFLDLRQGIPYFSEVLVKDPNIARLRDIFRQTILTTPRIESLESLSLDLDVGTRKLTVDFVAIKDDGTILASQEVFIIT